MSAVGVSLGRIDGAEKVAGQAVYAGDLPPAFTTFIMEGGGGPGPYGAKGMGEGGILPVAPAIGNAVFAAVGMRATEVPLLAEKIWRVARKII